MEEKEKVKKQVLKCNNCEYTTKKKFNLVRHQKSCNGAVAVEKQSEDLNNISDSLYLDNKVISNVLKTSSLSCKYVKFIILTESKSSDSKLFPILFGYKSNLQTAPPCVTKNGEGVIADILRDAHCHGVDQIAVQKNIGKLCIIWSHSK